MTYNIDLILNSLPLLLKGAFVTLKVLITSAMLSLSVGTLCGILSCRQVKIPVVTILIQVITFMLRGVPFFVQLLIVYFVLPDLISLDIDGLSASVIALGFCSSGYVAQIIRGVLNAIPTEQWECATSLGFSKKKALCSLILPQAFRMALPMLNNELDALLKSTAIISSIGILELTRVGMNIVSRQMHPVPIYLLLAAIYLLMSLIIKGITNILERNYRYVNN
ncbi:MAG: amino acid ABC transporter permease [Simkaniaceae bacterium]|nr:amino acid ABC transporter permease [Simkaniaceae bacterium]